MTGTTDVVVTARDCWLLEFVLSFPATWPSTWISPPTEPPRSAEPKHRLCAGRFARLCVAVGGVVSTSGYGCGGASGTVKA